MLKPLKAIMNSTVKLLVVYDNFFPAYKAGGPIQSLINLVLSMQKKIEIAVFTSGYDLITSQPLDEIKRDVWSQIYLPGSDAVVKVWYAGSRTTNRRAFTRCLEEVEPSVVYLNGMFSFRYVIMPLFSMKRKKIKLVVCPRGMLQTGALAGKSLKKKLYLSLLKISGLVKDVVWHATNEEEERDIKRIFREGSTVIIAKNIPRKPLDEISRSEKVTGKLRLVYLSLINEKKNLLQAIGIVSKSGDGITLDIYGPVSDPAYWKKCMQLIEKTQGKINYRGDLLPSMVQQLFCGYDASILLSKGENFGHALYESLSSGRPVITSYFTPWNDLQQKKAGWNLDIASNGSCIEGLNSICSIPADSFDEYCKAAWKLAKEYYAAAAELSNYDKLFSLNLKR